MADGIDLKCSELPVLNEYVHALAKLRNIAQMFHHMVKSYLKRQYYTSTLHAIHHTNIFKINYDLKVFLIKSIINLLSTMI